MAEARGAQGTVRGIPAKQVQDMLAQAVTHIRESGTDTFTRQALREFFLERCEVEEEQAAALEFAFFRSVRPEAEEYGLFTLPRFADAMVENREWRFTTGRLSLGEVIELVSLLNTQAKLGKGVGEGLERFHKRAKSALKGLGINPERI